MKKKLPDTVSRELGSKRVADDRRLAKDFWKLRI